MQATRLIRGRFRPSVAFQALNSPRAVFQRQYCASCDPVPAPQKAGSTSPDAAADHRQLGVNQELFTTSIYSPGSPLFLPNGARIFNNLVSFLRAQYAQFGFEEVITPTIYKKSLWEKSGHWENYADDMFAVTARKSESSKAETKAGEVTEEKFEDEEYGLKPMNCPGHCLLFASQRHSFRDLPIRYADFSPLHRNEISGALSGLTRVRRFHQDDAHIFCRPVQIGEEIFKTLEFVKLTYETFRLGEYKLVLSTRPEDHYIGEIEDWDRAEDALKDALTKSGKEWAINPGDGAFYGPKIDIILKDSDGKEHQTATIQLDFQLPKRFDLKYQAPAPEMEQKGLTTEDPELLATYGNVTPVIIHRAIFGSLERFFALLIEHYKGKWPFWLSPRQVSVLTVTDDAEVVNFAEDVVRTVKLGDFADKATSASGEASSHLSLLRTLASPSLAVDIDSTPRSVGKKIAEAKAKRYNIIAVIGKRDLQPQKEGPFAGQRTVTVDFTSTRDPEGRLAGVVAEEAGLAPGDVNLKNVQLTPEKLRFVLSRWAGMFE